MRIADCERVQTAWFEARALVLGGRVWSDGPLRWTLGPDGLNLMFPSRLTTAAVLRGVRCARERRLCIVGAWLSLDVDAAALADAGFERGWSPWWMTAELDTLELHRDPRVELQLDNEHYVGESAGYRDQLLVARELSDRVWYAAAYATPGQRFAGHAWSFLDGEFAGIFDMEVWPPFERQGLGTGLLHAVCAAARDAGAKHAVLNATPDGKQLYRRNGFTQIGEGITWWNHMSA